MQCFSVKIIAGILAPTETARFIKVHAELYKSSAWTITTLLFQLILSMPSIQTSVLCMKCQTHKSSLFIMIPPCWVSQHPKRKAPELNVLFWQSCDNMPQTSVQAKNTLMPTNERTVFDSHRNLQQLFLNWKPNFTQKYVERNYHHFLVFICTGLFRKFSWFWNKFSLDKSAHEDLNNSKEVLHHFQRDLLQFWISTSALSTTFYRKYTGLANEAIAWFTKNTTETTTSLLLIGTSTEAQWFHFYSSQNNWRWSWTSRAWIVELW